MVEAVLTPGRDPERIADTLRRVGDGSMMLRLRAGTGRTVPAEMLVIASEEMDRMREYLLETSGRLHQLASDHPGLPPRDMRTIADAMSHLANRRDENAWRAP